MPYPGIPKNLWPKMERCVADLKKKGGVDNPYAVCHASIMKEHRKGQGKKLVTELLGDDVDEMTTTGMIATLPMGMKGRSKYDSDSEVTPKDPEIVDTPTDLGPKRKT